MHTGLHAKLEKLNYPLSFESLEEERLDRKRKLAASFRLFGKFGFDEGLAGHITVRDPEHKDHFWINSFGISFKLMRVSDLILVNHDGEILEGEGLLNPPAFAIHSQIHKYLPHVTAAVHTHSIYGKSWSSLGRLLDPITQDSCAFYQDHVLYENYRGVILERSEGEEIARVLGKNKAAILQNHGLLTVGASIAEAAWWYVAMERSCQAQLLAEAAGEPKILSPQVAKVTHDNVGSSLAGQLSFKPLYDVISTEQPDLFN